MFLNFLGEILFLDVVANGYDYQRYKEENQKNSQTMQKTS